MILQKTNQQNRRNKQHKVINKTFYSLVGPGKTNLIFKKVKPVGEIQLNCLTARKTVRQKQTQPIFNSHRSPKTANTNSKEQQSAQLSCTNFMKNYVQRLKKQRKRQNKKFENSRTQKQEADKAYFSLNKIDQTKNDIYLAKQMNRIFILQRIPKKGNGIMNTVSIVEEDFSQNRIKQKSKILKENSKQLEWQAPAWANKQKIDKLIRQIRNSRNRVGVADQMPLLVVQQEASSSNKLACNLNLPALATRSRQIRSRAQSKQLKKVPQNAFKTLQPWKPEQNIPEYSIQEYYQKQNQSQ